RNGVFSLENLVVVSTSNGPALPNAARRPGISRVRVAKSRSAWSRLPPRALAGSGSALFSVFFSSRRRHTRCYRDWSSDVCSSDLVGGWNQDNLELTLTNHAVVQFRSLDDPERGRGQGLHGVWLDEAAYIVERAWHVLSPSLAENAGIVISTTSPAGFDWTYHTFFKSAVLDHETGYWAAKYRTAANPLFRH